jgi:hypothetical protein
MHRVNAAQTFDSLNVRLVGNWPFGDARAVAVDEARNLTFLGSGGGVYVIDISGPGNLTKVSERIHTRGEVICLSYDTACQRLYVACQYVGSLEAGLEVWDVSDPSQPVRTGSHVTQHRFCRYSDIVVIDSIVYVADAEFGLRVINVSDPFNPYETGYYERSGSPGVAVADSYAYVSAGDRGLKIIDISNSSSPTEIGHCEIVGHALRVVVSDSYAYVATSYDGLRIIDISDPLNPHEVGFDDFYDCREIAVMDSHVYLAEDAGLNVIDVTDPSNPIRVGRCTVGSVVWDVVVSCSCAYVVTSAGAQLGEGLKIIDISNSSTPVQLSYYGTPDHTEGVAVSGSYAYLCNIDFRVIDISDPSIPVEVGCCTASVYPIHVALSGSYAYATDLWGLSVIDISTPRSPFETGFCSLPLSSGGSSWNVTVSDSYAYVADGDAGLRILDITDPSDPYEVGYWYPTDRARDVAVNESYAYVTDSYGGLRVIDVSDPSTPVEVGCCDTPGIARGIALSDSLVYVADGSEGLRIVDISESSNPMEIGYCRTSSSDLTVAVSGSYAYVGDGDKTVRIIAISEPSNPTEVGYYMNPWSYANDVAVSGSHAYIAGFWGGLQIYEFYGVAVEEGSNCQLATGNRRLSIHPNPFSRCTSIEYHLPVEGRVALNLYDSSGRLVRALVNGQKKAGDHQVPFDRKGLNAGVYFTKLSVSLTVDCSKSNAETGERAEYVKTNKLIIL